MAPKHDNDHGHHNPSDPPSTTSVDCKLITCEDESIPSVTMQDENHIDIMDELATMVGSDCNIVQGYINDMVGNRNDHTVVEGNNDAAGEVTKQPPNQLRSSIPKSTLHQISKMIMKEAVEDKKMELTQSGMKIPGNNVDVLDLINTSDLYGLINDGINKHNHRNTIQGVTNDMIGNTNVPTTVHSSNKATYTEQDELTDVNEDLRHLHYGLENNINDDDNKNSHDNTTLADNGLKSNNTIGAHIVEEKEGWFYEWADTYDEWNSCDYTCTEENEPGSLHTFTGDNNIFKITKIKHNGISKTRLVSETSTSVNSDFYTGERQK